MKYVEVIAPGGNQDTLAAIAERFDADFHSGAPDSEGNQIARLLVTDDRLQELLDVLQTTLGAQPQARILVLPVEIAIPEPPAADRAREDSATETREALYAGVEKGTHLDINYLVLVVLSTAVAAIGLLEDNVAVVIGAMVIAPAADQRPGRALQGAQQRGVGRPQLRRPTGLDNDAQALLPPVQSHAISRRKRCTSGPRYRYSRTVSKATLKCSFDRCAISGI